MSKKYKVRIRKDGNGAIFGICLRGECGWYRNRPKGLNKHQNGEEWTTKIV